MPMMFYKNLLLLLTSLFLALPSAGQTITGHIYNDMNGNSRFDPDEKGISDVLISNGKQIVSTNKDGTYHIKINEQSLIFPILPTGYRFKAHENWWKNFRRLSSQKMSTVNFPLYKTAKLNKFQILAIGDVQVADKTELAYAARTIMADLAQPNNDGLKIFLGDLVNDDVSLFQPFKEMVNRLTGPSYMVYGNHDRKKAATTKHKQEQSFNHFFGPVNYAFFKNDVLFITLNSLIPKGEYGYENIYDKRTLTFLKNILKHITGQERQIVVSQHIPLKWMKNNERIFELFSKNKNVLVLAGHSHTVFQDFYPLNSGGYIHELDVGATAGNWWTGQKDWEGNPLALMADGTPRGYFKINFDQDSYKFQYKPVGYPKDKQMSIWFGKNPKEITQEVDEKDRDIFINVFSGSKKTNVKIKVDDRKWITLHKVLKQDPFVKRVKRLQKEGLYPNKLSDTSPYLHRPSYHLWKGSITSDLSKGLHELTVEVTDPYQKKMSRNTWFWDKAK